MEVPLRLLVDALVKVNIVGVGVGVSYGGTYLHSAQKLPGDRDDDDDDGYDDDGDNDDDNDYVDKDGNDDDVD